MIVPDYWSEASREIRTANGQVTLRRFGWSDSSNIDAQSMAETRVEEACRRVLSGEKVVRREPKVPYNGADGVPIREEVLARHGEEVITRNGYGAHCLNSPRVLFADIDFPIRRLLWPSFLAFALLATASIGIGIWLRKGWVTAVLLLFACSIAVLMSELLSRLAQKSTKQHETIARHKIVAFVAANPSWNLRLYRTPAGYRVLATHQTFNARSDDVLLFFRALSVDPMYIRMCIHQNCFRARLTAKPWRVGIPDHIRPRPGVWPVRKELMPIRTAWIARYEEKAADFAACRYMESLGSGRVDSSLRPVIDMHDRESRALAFELPIA